MAFYVYTDKQAFICSTIFPISSYSFYIVYLRLTTMCPRSSDPFYTVTYDIKWATTL